MSRNSAREFKKVIIERKYSCLCVVVSDTYHVVLCFCFVLLRLVCTMLPFSLDCPLLIA
jgi:hypothetical protein